MLSEDLKYVARYVEKFEATGIELAPKACKHLRQMLDALAQEAAVLESTVVPELVRKTAAEHAAAAENVVAFPRRARADWPTPPWIA